MTKEKRENKVNIFAMYWTCFFTINSIHGSYTRKSLVKSRLTRDSLLLLRAYNRFWFRLLKPWYGLGHLDHDITNDTWTMISLRVCLVRGEIRKIENKWEKIGEKMGGRSAWFGQGGNFGSMFKLKPVTTYHLGFIVKILWT